MSRRGQLVLAGVLVLAGIVGVVLLFTMRSGSPRSYIDDNYALVSREGDSAVYSSPQPASAVVKDISDRWSPADQVVVHKVMEAIYKSAEEEKEVRL